MGQGVNFVVSSHDDPNEFLELAGDLLAQDETKNNLILGLALRLKQDLQAFGQARPLMALVRDDFGNIAAAAVMTPPFPVVVYCEPINQFALEALVDFLLVNEWQVSGVNGVEAVSEAFARIWQEKTGQASRIVVRMRAYELRSVVRVEYPDGEMRLAKPHEAQVAADMLNAMGDEVVLGPRRIVTAESQVRQIEGGNVFFWEDSGKIVTVTIANRPQIKGICLSGVYTLPEQRKKGYARALVAEVSRELLRRGYELTNLFTDLSNPTSNKIYQEVGYQPVCDYHQYEFVSDARI
jgi:predicted GNAT family acetyltransferase